MLYKKIMKIIIVIIVVIALIAGGIFTAKAISANMIINETKEKLSKIDAKELENKIIERLEKSPLNVNTGTTKTEVSSKYI